MRTDRFLTNDYRKTSDRFIYHSQKSANCLSFRRDVLTRLVLFQIQDKIDSYTLYETIDFRSQTLPPEDVDDLIHYVTTSYGQLKE